MLQIRQMPNIWNDRILELAKSKGGEIHLLDYEDDFIVLLHKIFFSGKFFECFTVGL